MKLIWILVFLTSGTPQGRLKQARMVHHARPELCTIDSQPNCLRRDLGGQGQRNTGNGL